MTSGVDRSDDAPDRALLARHEQRVEASRQVALAAGVDEPPTKTVAAADSWLDRALELRARKGRSAKRKAVDGVHDFESSPRPRRGAQQLPAGGLAALFATEPDRGIVSDADDILAFLDATPSGDEIGSPPGLPIPDEPGAADADLRQLLELYVDSDEEQT